MKKGGTPTKNSNKISFKNVESRLFNATKSIKDKYGSRYSSAEDEARALTSKSPPKSVYYTEKEEKKP